MGRSRFKKPKEPKGPKYLVADEVALLAARIIDQWHSHLGEARIKYLFRNGKWSKKGNTTLGMARLASDDTRFIGQYEFVVIINLEAWNNASQEARIALLDHELSHCSCEEDKSGNKRWSIIDHDVKEFVGIVSRHGIWADDLKRLMSAATAAEKEETQGKLFVNDLASESADDETEGETVPADNQGGTEDAPGVAGTGADKPELQQTV